MPIVPSSDQAQAHYKAPEDGPLAMVNLLKLKTQARHDSAAARH